MRKLFQAAFAVVLAVGVAQGQGPLSFTKVDYFEAQGDGEKKRDARLELDPTNKILRIVDEHDGASKGKYLAVPYGSITKIVYERSAHRRYKAGLLVSPWLLLTMGKKHWLALEFSGVSAYPAGFGSAQLDKDNYRRILTALSAATGLEVVEMIED